MKEVAYLDTSNEFKFSIERLCLGATKGDFILANYFVIRNDPYGNHFLNLLITAASNGACIKLIIDSYGSLHPSDEGSEYQGGPLEDKILNYLTINNIEIYIYRPIKSTKIYSLSNIVNWDNFSRRNHNKNFLFELKSLKKSGLVIGDSQWALEHFNGEYKGSNCIIYDNNIFQQSRNYHKELLNSGLLKRYIPSKQYKVINGLSYENVNLIFDSYKEASFVHNQITFNSASDRATLQDYEVKLINKARNNLIYTTPYFCPDNQLKHALMNSIKKVTKYRALIGNFKGHPFMPFGIKKATQDFLKSNIDIHYYNGDGNIHYKDMISDNHVFMKTSNGEGRSRFYNQETGVIFNSKKLAEKIEQKIERDFKYSNKVCCETKWYIGHSWFSKNLKELLIPLYYHHL
jgi:cardiolipin synthase